MNDPVEGGSSEKSQHTTTPLGGSTHRVVRPPLSRHWSGFVPVVRRCPVCNLENPSTAIFCPDCGSDLRQVELTAATSERPGIQVMRARLLREARQQERMRVQGDQGGNGWVFLSLFLLVPAIIISSDSAIRYGLWAVGIASALFGFWKIRKDSTAIRGWGVFFGIVTISTFAYLGVQVSSHESIPAADRAIIGSPRAQVQGTAVQADASGLASGKFTTDVLSFRGDSGHSGRQPGPAPASNLKLAWRFDTGGEVYSTPVIAGGILYVSSKDGFLHALNAGTGQEVWRVQLTAYVVRSSPAIADGVVYIGAGFNLFALDAKTGAQIWTVALRYAGQSTPTIADGLVVVPSQEGWIYALSAKTGELKWRVPTDGVVFGAPAISNGVVAIGTDKGTVYTVKIDSGQLLWRKSVTGSVVASPTIVGNVVYFTSESGKTSAFDFGNGGILWTAEIGGPQPLAVADGQVIVSSTDGGVYALNAETGASTWLYPSGKPKLAAPVAVGRIIFLGAGNTLLSLDAKTGKLGSYYLANGIIGTSPLVVDGFVFFGSTDGFVYAVDSAP